MKNKNKEKNSNRKEKKKKIRHHFAENRADDKTRSSLFLCGRGGGGRKKNGKRKSNLFEKILDF